MKLRLACLSLLLFACSGPSGAARGPGSPPGAEQRAGTATAAAEIPAATRAATAHVTVIGLSDFHGWISPLEPRGFSRYYGGIANLAGQLRDKEHIDPSTSIIVDNGDMWTGPTEATFLRGEPVVQAYNALGVTAVNVANHEFDFGVDVLRAREKEAHFPFLGANILHADTKAPVDFARPFTMVERDGVKIGIIGLSFMDTPHTTMAKHVAGLEFADYASTLRRVVPEVRALGANAVVVLLHDTVEEAQRALEPVKDLDITAVVAGQNHRKGSATVGQTQIVNPGPFGRSYVRFDLDVDRATRRVVDVRSEIVDVVGEVTQSPHAPPELVEIVEAAQKRSQSLASEVLGRIAKPLPVGSFDDSPVGEFVVDAWLDALPDADVAICNHGAFRQALASGPVSMADLIGVMPFENNLFVVRLSGKQLKETLALDGPVVGGASWTYREGPAGKRTVESIVDRRGRPFEDRRTYKVVINDFMYHGGDGYRFEALDPNPEDTGLSWRQPAIRMLRLAEATGRRLDPPLTRRARSLGPR